MFPLGVTTAEVLVGRASTFQGTAATVHVTVTPILNGGGTHLVHYATGFVLARIKDSYRGDEVSFRVPHADQTGFRDESDAAATGWHYRADVQIEANGETVSYSKEFQPLVGQDVIDLDSVPGGPTLQPAAVVVPAVSSLNGQTGALSFPTIVVTMTQADYDAAVLAGTIDPQALYSITGA